MVKMRNNVLDIHSREEFRAWLTKHGQTETECFVFVRRGEPEEGVFAYVDAVEEALCFGWIDSVLTIIDGKPYERFSPRRENSPWTELNKERARRLIHLGLMTEQGRKALPPLGPRSFHFDKIFIEELKKARVYAKFRRFPPLYQRIRAYNVVFYRDWNKRAYKAALNHLIEETKKGKMFGEWNDYGRLLDWDK